MVMRGCGVSLVFVCAWSSVACTGDISHAAQDARDVADGSADDNADGGAATDSDALAETVDGAAPPPDGVPMFVAIGKMGRITMSCDDGNSWPVNRSDSPGAGADCTSIDCDHHAGSSVGLTYGGGYFFANFGWGAPTTLRRSANGVDWQSIFEPGDFAFGSIAWGADRLVAGVSSPRYSDDSGASFTQIEWPAYQLPEGQWPVVRTAGFAPVDGGRFAVIAAGNDWADTVISSDGGQSYQHPTALPAECRGHRPRMAFGRGTWIQTWNSTGTVCRSVDAGDTWHVVHTFSADASPPIWTGTEFIVYVGSRGHRSADGRTWLSFDLRIDNNIDSNATLAHVAYNPVSRAFVGVGGIAVPADYDAQRFYRSADGISWTVLGETAAVRSHAITHIAFGYGAASATCP